MEHRRNMPRYLVERDGGKLDPCVSLTVAKATGLPYYSKCRVLASRVPGCAVYLHKPDKMVYLISADMQIINLED